ncbi:MULTISPECIES: DNA cytosine methyltransferase [Stenotrophomonas]|uniref:DNA cytosine methyltransferase n=1 Tax=Stenotrophomonas TaxID=40323 RepID=UPI0016603038|nr:MULTISPECIES: DNA cytosine methyltransferase [Stenotrophomonas]MBN5058843.1 DNA cytosine methyltransferase [Stenotrophomonas maltophilia]MBN5067175.1 DNA cytosine methyltransferase [Stenotrophomonas maltophilia]MCW8342871.1 DNA cytosine methyltransferase [Stenotrophomonas sp. SG1]UGB19419.1 DNA cytosine methyltransferase [Stenotrophomonas maltophilia]UGB50340.1 DNA cytosine methyltransferase [Stenotrophomonas maltophilia]
MAEVFEIRHAGLFAGLGAGARGFNQARPDIGSARAKFRCIGGIDVDPAAVADFAHLAGVPGTVLDLFSLQQYRAFWGCNPPPGWREAGTADVHRAFGHERPHVVFLSAPCKGFSGLMSESKSKTAKYQALNELTLRGIWLTLEAYKDDPVEVLLFENVPRIATRGRHLLDQITALLRAYGYVVNETTHDCGELGGLAQSRKRFLLVARHAEKVPPFLYEPVKRPLQAVGTVLGRMPLAGDVERGGPMHRVPSLQWKTWVRLAFVEAGSDWRSLNRLAVEDGVLSDYLIVPESRGGFLGVRGWDDHSGTVAGESLPSNGAFSVADPRAAAGVAQYQQYGVMQMTDTAGAVIGVKSPGQGTFSVADPRHGWSDGAHSSKYRIVAFDRSAGTVTGSDRVGSGAACVADPRSHGGFQGAGKYPVAPFDAPSRTVIARSDTGHGAYAVADPRPANQRQQGDAYLTNGHYGVVAWGASSGAVSAAAGHDNGKWSVADPRLPDARKNLVCVIRSMDNTWHRPFTTLELAALQSLVDPEETLELYGLSDQAWRERIGNAVPPAAACAIAEEIGRTLLLAWTGQTFALSSTPIWVRDVAVAMALPGEVRQ